MVAVGFALSKFCNAKPIRLNSCDRARVACQAKKAQLMKTILLLHDGSGSPKPRLQNAEGGKLTTSD